MCRWARCRKARKRFGTKVGLSWNELASPAEKASPNVQNDGIGAHDAIFVTSKEHYGEGDNVFTFAFALVRAFERQMLQVN
ncbi:MAG: hypothetical protein ACTS6G_01430 [Candidatus Hodgkinia cicadicola]